LKVEWLFVMLSIAAIAGDTVNYMIGHYVGPGSLPGRAAVFQEGISRADHRFYEKYGGKTIIIARFVLLFGPLPPLLRESAA